MATKSTLVKDIVVGVIIILSIGTLVGVAGFKWIVPALERQADRRYIERQYEREAYRLEIESNLQKVSCVNK